MQTYYDVLTITTDAPNLVIRAVYDAICQKYSPENYEGDKKIQAEKAIKKLTIAYETLSDPIKRKNYDASIGIIRNSQ